MTRSRYNFFLDEDQKAALNQIRERDGITQSEQIRRAIRQWIDDHGVTETKTKRKRKTKKKAERKTAG
jgi:hypothetical protein